MKRLLVFIFLIPTIGFTQNKKELYATIQRMKNDSVNFQIKIQEFKNEINSKENKIQTLEKDIQKKSDDIKIYEKDLKDLSLKLSNSEENGLNITALFESYKDSVNNNSITTDLVYTLSNLQFAFGTFENYDDGMEITYEFIIDDTKENLTLSSLDTRCLPKSLSNVYSSAKLSNVGSKGMIIYLKGHSIGYEFIRVGSDNFLLGFIPRAELAYGEYLDILFESLTNLTLIHKEKKEARKNGWTEDEDRLRKEEKLTRTENGEQIELCRQKMGKYDEGEFTEFIDNMDLLESFAVKMISGEKIDSTTLEKVLTFHPLEQLFLNKIRAFKENIDSY